MYDYEIFNLYFVMILVFLVATENIKCLIVFKCLVLINYYDLIIVIVNFLIMEIIVIYIYIIL